VLWVKGAAADRRDERHFRAFSHSLVRCYVFVVDGADGAFEHWSNSRIRIADVRLELRDGRAFRELDCHFTSANGLA
jgi:hypothetical protein